MTALRAQPTSVTSSSSVMVCVGAFRSAPVSEPVLKPGSGPAAGVRLAAVTGSAMTARLQAAARRAGWGLEQLHGNTEARFLADAAFVAEQVALVFLDAEACGDPRIYADFRIRFPFALMVGEHRCNELDLVVHADIGECALDQLLQHAADHRSRGRRIHSLIREVGVSRRRMLQLTEIGNALTSSRSLDELLGVIVAEGRRLANCDAASLYLIDADDHGTQSLVFKLSENDSVKVPFGEARLPLTAGSIAGYVALYGRELNLPDAYAIPDSAPYGFNCSFDEQMGYRTRSMLVLPMRDHHDRVVGVLQFINRLAADHRSVIAFDEEVTDLLRAIASQAAVSIQKNLLIEDMSNLFESFVQASVKTVEQRDPTTSGHSFRVADKTVALLTALPQSSSARFRDLKLTPSHLREVRYAALLHDVGKIGVRESVLVKARKLLPERLAVIEHRIELQRERLRRAALERQLKLMHQGQPPQVVLQQIEQELAAGLAHLDQVWEWVHTANEPRVVEAGVFAHIDQLRDVPYLEPDGRAGTLLTPLDIEALSVRRGSLTPAEREQIQGHVSHTREFLEMLKWPPELSAVPTIAGAHHEKLNGSGYPLGLVADQIPLASRVMTVCDIYDALTAMDRPYKRSIATDEALAILEQEAAAQLLDADIVRIFIESRVYQRPDVFSSTPR